MTKNAYAGTVAIIQGADSMMDPEPFIIANLDDITIKNQIRVEFEDEENSLQNLADSIKAEGLHQPLLLRFSDDLDRPYVLVDGERRYRAARLAGITELPAFIRDLTEKQAKQAQFSTAVQKKNLKFFEEAVHLQELLDEAGSVDKLLVEINQSHSWLSKRLSFLKLPEQAKRLIKNNASADREVLNQVAAIEKKNPEAAKAVVDHLIENKGLVDARQVVGETARSLKHAKTKAVKQEQLPLAGLKGADYEKIRQKLYAFVYSKSKTLRFAAGVMTEFSDEEYAMLENEMKTVHAKASVESTFGVIDGLIQGYFSEKGIGAIRLSVYLNALAGGKFNLEDTLDKLVAGVRSR